MPAMSPGRRNCGQRTGTLPGCFRPGENLSDYVTHFVHSGELGPNGRATSQWEALLQSECKKERRPSYLYHLPRSPQFAPCRTACQLFRSRCLTCHGAPVFVTKHHPDQPDCSSCHMPREKSGDVAHEQVTDHRIQRRAGAVFRADAAHRRPDPGGRRNTKRPRPRAGLFPDGKPWGSGSGSSRDDVAATG